MNKPIGYWTKRLDAALETHLDRTLARLKLSRRQWQALNVLAETALSPGDLDGVLSPFWGDDTRRRESELAALVGRGMIIMVDDRISLSELGHAKQAEAQRLVEDSRRELSMGSASTSTPWPSACWNA
ncbi:hypothetical protein GCM10023063_11180 [Arthrobacter methylotrophus]|uniref:MarR family transcriptional regulator n=1 Tax=Arthrobacter methylotrophus TaxID=121291 RepID=A0ABV5URQ7_9MICC